MSHDQELILERDVVRTEWWVLLMLNIHHAFGRAIPVDALKALQLDYHARDDPPKRVTSKLNLGHIHTTTCQLTALGLDALSIFS